jgi:two-component system response regulator HydG
MTPGLRGSVLVVDDDEAMCRVVAEWLSSRGFPVTWRTDPIQALSLVGEHDIDAVIADLTMPRLDGVQLCREIACRRPGLPVLLLTAYGSLDSAVGAIRAGAYDFIAKPVDLEVLEVALERALSHAALRREVRLLRSATSPARSFGPIVGESPAMRQLYEVIDRCAGSDLTILVHGESGTGKELVARALHEQSSRASAPFVAINCAAIPETLIESELFGHESGAFTGANRKRAGLFVRAQGGTVFLDEVSELPPGAQAKLLRVLQERSVLPVGADRETAVDVRVVAATHQDLEEAVAARRFRADLMYRLDVLSVALPPLRARGNDVLVLAEHFLREAAAHARKPVIGWSADVTQALVAYRWPGNVRELRNCIERAVILASGPKVQLTDLPEKVTRTTARVPGTIPDETEGYLSLEEVERRYVLAVLDSLGGNKTEAGRVLGLDRRTIARKLQAWGIPE